MTGDASKLKASSEEHIKPGRRTLRLRYRARQLKALESMPAMHMPRILFAELFGTWALVIVAAGGGTIAAAAAAPQTGLAANVVAPALMVGALIYVLGPISGAHFNPAVTLAFAIRGDFPWRYVPGFWIAQLIGSALAAGILRALFGNVGHLGANIPRHGVGTSMVMEMILTLLLVTIILGTAAHRKIVGHNAAIAVAFTIALAGLFAAPISGASMNPARSLGPALVTGDLADQWIYVVGPFAGAILATVIAFILRGGTTQDAIEAASGSVLSDQSHSPQSA
ncbi:MAG TPA: aquaporin [Chloroflexota bacterium]